MPTDHVSTLMLLLRAAIGLAILGCVAAAWFVVRSRRRAWLDRQRAEARFNETRHAGLEQQLQHLEEQLRTTERALTLQTERAANLNAKLTEAQQSAAEQALRVPMPRDPLQTLSDAEAITERQWETKLRTLEASLAQARRNREIGEQLLKKANQLNQQQVEKISKLISQVDEVASSLEETQITLAEKQRELAECARREQLCGVRITELEARELDLVRSTAAARDELNLQLQEKQSAYTTLERMLQDATAAEVQLRRDLKAVALGREQLEHQNIELKTILDRVCGSTIDLPDAASPSTSEQDPAAAAAAVFSQWSAVTENEIHDAVLQLAAMPSQSPVSKERPAPASSERNQPVQSSDIEQELREAKVRLHVLESSMGDLEYLREQNAKLREELSQDRGAARELTALQLEHKRLKLDLQLAEQKLESQNATVEDLSGVNLELQRHKAELAVLGSLPTQLRDLRAENFALRNANSGMYRVAESALPKKSDSRELAVLPLDTAVISDHLGLPVAATGALSAESMAAVSGLAAQIAAHVRELLPVGPITTVQWIDQYGMTVTCKLFKLAGDEMAMTTLASGIPSEQALKETLKTVLQSIGWTEEGPKADAESNAAVG